MRRREFIGAVGAVLVVATIGSARAAERKSSHRIAIVLPSAPVTVISESTDAFWRSLFNELRRLGHVEGDNLVIERYSGEGRAPHYPELARDVVSRDPDMIFAVTNNLVLDFKAATTAIPIVGLFGVPVEAGIVVSLARPGGKYHRGICRCRDGAVGQAVSIVAAGDAAGDEIRIPPNASSTRAVGGRSTRT
jgi:putative tryptophan/tyrosine transport system substrate-binding protein